MKSEVQCCRREINACFFDRYGYNSKEFPGKKTMKIGVISDTHLRVRDERLRKISEDYFGDVEMILHAGDLVDVDILEAFPGKEVRAVYGNMDSDEVRKRLPESLLLEVNGFKVGLIHGWGMPFGLEKKIRKKFGDLDCIVFGHTHHACNKIRDRVLYFNPGSATDRRFTKQNSVGILEIGDRISGRIIEISR
jgi:putative phosphoesterase